MMQQLQYKHLLDKQNSNIIYSKKYYLKNII